MESEIRFNKYLKKGPDYHWKQIDKKRFREFNAFVFARYMFFVNEVKKLLKYAKNKKVRILDVGCGDGVLLYLIKKNNKNVNFEIYGLDLSKEALSIAKNRIPEGSFTNTEVYDLNFEDNFFDIIVSSDVIEHVNNPKRMLKEIKRVLNNEGFVIIGTPIRYTEEPLDKMHYYEFYPKEFNNLIKNFFNSLELKETHNLFYYLLYNKIFNVFGKNIVLFRYIINIFTIFGFNPFLKQRRYRNELFVYMYCIAKNNNK